MDVSKVSVGKLISSFGTFGSLVIDSQMPIIVFVDPMSLDETVFLLCGWLVLAPCISVVKDKSSVADELLGVVEGPPVQFHGHDLYSSRGGHAPDEHAVGSPRAETVRLGGNAVWATPSAGAAATPAMVRCRTRAQIGAREDASASFLRGRRPSHVAPPHH